MAHVDLSRVPEFYHHYISLVGDRELKNAFLIYQPDFISLLESIPEEKWNFRYAEGKWTIKEMIQHIIDAERIFCYRALCFARKEQTPLPGFDENNYAAVSKADKRTKESLISEFRTVQKSSAQLFDSFDEEQLESSGIANGKPNYVRAIGYIIIGHMLNHRNVLLERYLVERA